MPAERKEKAEALPSGLFADRGTAAGPRPVSLVTDADDGACFSMGRLAVLEFRLGSPHRRGAPPLPPPVLPPPPAMLFRLSPLLRRNSPLDRGAGAGS